MGHQLSWADRRDMSAHIPFSDVTMRCDNDETCHRRTFAALASEDIQETGNKEFKRWVWQYFGIGSGRKATMSGWPRGVKVNVVIQ